MKKQKLKSLAMKGGTYSIIITAIVIAIVVVINIIAAKIPAAYTNYDISSTQLYSITSNTKAVVNALEKDITIYWIVQSGEEDDVIENLLSKYDSLSGHVAVVKKNPDVYPTFAAQYTDETVANNSLIVESEDRSRYIAYDEIYVTNANMSTYSYDYSFDGEGAITSAIDYVVSEELPQLYVLEGHGESELPTTFSDQLVKENIETTSFSLLNEDEIPEECDAILIYAPTSDISEDEKDILAEYCENGGKLMVVAGPVKDTDLTNLYSILSDYGVEAVEGIAVETDRNYYAFQQPYILLPEIQSSDITDPLIEENYYAIIPLAAGLDVSNADSTVTTLLSTSETSYSKAAGYSLTTYDKEDEDIDGPFALGVEITTGSDGAIIWYTSSYMLDDMYNSYSSGANLDLAINSLSSLIGESDAVSIRSKSLSYNYLTISDSTASLLKTIMIGIIPGIYIAIGIVVVVNRRRKQNEAV